MNLTQSHSTLVKTWHPTLNLPLTPETVTAGSDKKVHWQCEVGHVWLASISSRTRQKSGCTYCNNRYVLEGFNDLATSHLELIREWHPAKNGDLQPTQVTAGSGRKVWWLCKKGHEWQTSVRNRKLGVGCHYCRKIATTGFNDLATLFPDIAANWHPTLNEGLLPDQVLAQSNKYVWWLCEEGHATRTKVNNKTVLGRGCGVCTNRTLLRGYNDLATTNPELVDEWDYEKNSAKTPSTVMGGSSNSKYWWKCSKDSYRWSAAVFTRAAGTGCPLCANRVVVTGINDLSSTHPKIAAEFNLVRNEGIQPTEIVAGTAKFYWWRCAEGHEWKTSPNIRWRQGTNCPQCSNRRVSTTNNLEVLFRYLLEEWDLAKNKDIKPSQVLPLSALKHWWKCKEGHSWRAAPRTRIRGTGCPTCSKHGYSQAENGYLYLLRRENPELQQFGISNQPSVRLATHGESGWEVLDVVGPADGTWILETETALKAFFRHQGLLLPRDYVDRFDGYTESWSADSVRYDSISSLLEGLREWEWGQK